MSAAEWSGPSSAEALEQPESVDPLPAEAASGFASVVENDTPTWRIVLHLAWPALAQQVLVLVVGLSDRFLAGHFQPADPSKHAAYQAAQTTAHYLSWFISSYTVLVSVGSTAMVARFVGAGDQKGAVRATNQSILLALVLGVAGTILGLTCIEGIVWLLQLRGDAASFAVSYLRPLIVLLVFQVLESACIACLIGAADMRTGLYVRGGVALCNLPLAWGFYHGIGPIPGMGFAGIALGTAASNMLGGLAVLMVLLHGRAGLRLRLAHLRPDWDMLRRLLRIGIPAGIDSIFIALGHLWFLSVVNRVGEVAAGAHGIALGWEAMGFLSGAAFGTAAMTLVGQNLGAGRPDRARHSGLVSFAIGGSVMSLMGVIFYSFAPQMFALFCPHPEQEPIIRAGVPVLRLVAFAMPAAASVIILSFALRGAGDTRVPMIFTFIGFLGVRLPLAYWFSLPEVDLFGLAVVPGWNLGLLGAWLAMFADLMVRGCFFQVRFWRGRWQTLKV